MKQLVEAIVTDNPLDLEKVLSKLESQQDLSILLNHCNWEGETLFHLACRLKKYSCLEQLLNYAPLKDIPDKQGRSALYSCIDGDDLVAAKILLSHNADINASYFDTVLKQDVNLAFVCYQKNKINLLRFLLRQHIDPTSIIEPACQRKDVATLFAILFFMGDQKLSEDQKKLIMPFRFQIWGQLDKNFNNQKNFSVKNRFYTLVLRPESAIGSMYNQKQDSFFGFNTAVEKAREFLAQNHASAFEKTPASLDLSYRYRDYGTFSKRN